MRFGSFVKIKGFVIMGPRRILGELSEGLHQLLGEFAGGCPAA
jgi:hypothetical protein